MVALAQRGLSLGGAVSLTVVGRKTGRLHTIPVTPIQVDGQRYLVAPYGAVDWVRNLRAARTAILRRGGKVERIVGDELDPVAAAPVLKAYVKRVRVVRPYIEVKPDDDLAAFEAIVPRHPVFVVHPAD